MNYGDYVSADYLFNRLSELETDLEIHLEENEDGEDDFDDMEELEMLRDVCENIELYGGSSETLISEDVFTEYVEEFLKDCFGIDLPEFVVNDWESTADNLKVDYADVEIDGTTYYFRAG